MCVRPLLLYHTTTFYAIYFAVKYNFYNFAYMKYMRLFEMP